MASRADLLRTEIEKTKHDLANHLAELRVESRAAGRKVAARAGLAMSAIVLTILAFKAIGSVRRRHST